jgi:predicted RNA-binding protein associated with RNAse of E/G family
LSGQEKRFECMTLAHEGSHLLVLFVAAANMHVHGVDLPAGTVTFGHFWTGRPYNVYHWLDAATGSTIGAYVNLSDNTSISDERLEWRDLIVDLLLMPDGRATVLDEDELPLDLPPALRLQIASAQASVLASRSDLIAELEHHRAALWPRLPLAAREAR